LSANSETADLVQTRAFVFRREGVTWHLNDESSATSAPSSRFTRLQECRGSENKCNLMNAKSENDLIKVRPPSFGSTSPPSPLLPFVPFLQGTNSIQYGVSYKTLSTRLRHPRHRSTRLLLRARRFSSRHQRRRTLISSLCLVSLYSAHAAYSCLFPPFFLSFDRMRRLPLHSKPPSSPVTCHL
jgi:hypothetical protein